MIHRTDHVFIVSSSGTASSSRIGESIRLAAGWYSTGLQD